MPGPHFAWNGDSTVAYRCARTIGDAMSSLGIQVRCGLHTGEIELDGSDVSGDRRRDRGPHRCARPAFGGARLADRAGPPSSGVDWPSKTEASTS